ncbi:unnamed protein product, partial [Rotaria magnacalcarata]
LSLLSFVSNVNDCTELVFALDVLEDILVDTMAVGDTGDAKLLIFAIKGKQQQQQY